MAEHSIGAGEADKSECAEATVALVQDDVRDAWGEMSVTAFLVLSPEQVNRSKNIVDGKLFPGCCFVPLKESFAKALDAALDRSIMSGKVAWTRTTWFLVEIPLSTEFQLRAFHDETLVRDKFHSGWKLFAPLDLSTMTGVKVFEFTMEKVPMFEWTQRALDGGWLERRDGSKCAQCPAQDISVWATKSSSALQTREFYCGNCWLREMLHQHGVAGTATERKKGGVVDAGIEDPMARLGLHYPGLAYLGDR